MNMERSRAGLGLARMDSFRYKGRNDYEMFEENLLTLQQRSLQIHVG